MAKKSSIFVFIIAVNLFLTRPSGQGPKWTETFTKYQDISMQWGLLSGCQLLIPSIRLQYLLQNRSGLISTFIFIYFFNRGAFGILIVSFSLVGSLLGWFITRLAGQKASCWYYLRDKVKLNVATFSFFFIAIGECMFISLIKCRSSNHDRDPDADVLRILERHNVPYHCLRTNKDDKREQEILELVQDTDFLVLARYMQVSL